LVKYFHNTKVFLNSYSCYNFRRVRNFQSYSEIEKTPFKYFEKLGSFLKRFGLITLPILLMIYNKTVVCAVPEGIYSYIHIKNNKERERHFFYIKNESTLKIAYKKEKKE